MKIAKTLRIALKAMLMKAGKVETDKAILVYDGEGELTEGMEVFVEITDEEGNTEFVAAEDGEYATEDGTKITVEGGKVAKIEKPAEEETVEEPETVVEELAEETPEVEPIEEPEVEEVEVPEEDRIKTLEEKVAALAEGIEKIMNAFVAIEERIAGIEEKLAAVEAEPATDPVVEEAEVNDKKGRLSYLQSK